MQSTMQHALLIVGVFLIVSGVILGFFKREVVTVALLLLLGVVVCLVAALGVDGFAPNRLGVSATLKKQLEQGLMDAKLDIKQYDAAPISHDIQKINDALVKQDAFNKLIASAVNKLQADAAGGASPILQPNINSTSSSFEENSPYSVLVFYRTSRADDAQALVKQLTAAGFQTSSIATPLANANGDQSVELTYITPTDRGFRIKDQVEKIALQLKLPNVNVLDPEPAKRGDVQVHLY
jgi:hypothetical protein